MADGDGELQARTDGIHLPTELAQKGLEVGSVGFAGKLPVKVDAVEEARSFDSGSEVSFEKDVDAGGDEGLAVAGLGVLGEVGGATFERDKDAQARELALEKLKLVEMAAKGAGGRVRDAIDALLRGEGEVQVGVGVRYGAAAIRDEPLGIVDLVDERGLAAGRDKVFYEIRLLIVERPLRKVAHECGMGERLLLPE
jgi:hypothetical protein